MSSTPLIMISQAGETSVSVSKTLSPLWSPQVKQEPDSGSPISESSLNSTQSPTPVGTPIEAKNSMNWEDNAHMSPTTSPSPSQSRSHLARPPPTQLSTWSSSSRSVEESLHDLISRVEEWRGGLKNPAPTDLKRNKAYVGLWALGVQDLACNPVVVTALSSPAGSILSRS